MALKKRGKQRYGENHADIREEIRRYSEKNGYPAEHFADAVCTCGAKVFRLALDDTEGAGVRKCVACTSAHPIGDSADYLADADLGECACPCGNEDLELSIGVALYQESEDVRWLYLGCRCVKCGLTAVYGDWKSEFNGYKGLLARV